ncbi:hypothetical protein [Streptosporangium roseum]|uniref:hypothetical protein n=1 Tax=Streptosporangium roseum TaxID=2001 RepID=UPI00333097BB
MLEGELTLSVYGKGHVVQVGDAVVRGADRPQGHADRGDVPLRFHDGGHRTAGDA